VLRLSSDRRLANLKTLRETTENMLINHSLIRVPKYVCLDTCA
jgi:hypothetical protein